MEASELGFMRQALRQAKLAEAAGEVPVGAVIVWQGTVIGRAGNAVIGRHDPTWHAEIGAIRRAATRMANYRLCGADLYVTLEPCPMCYAAMVQARIARLFYGASDAKGGFFSSGALSALEPAFNHHIEVSGGHLAEESKRMLQEFFQARRGAGAVERDGLENRCTG